MKQRSLHCNWTGSGLWNNVVYIVDVPVLVNEQRSLHCGFTGQWNNVVYIVDLPVWANETM